jgi:hypothetical protein
LRGLLLGGRLLVLSVASSIALVGLALLWCLGERVEAPYAVPAYLGLICIPILTLTDIQDGVARARGLMALGLLPPYVLRPLLLIVGLGAAHLCGLPVNARVAIAAAIVASLGAAIVQTLLLRHRLRRELPPGPHRYAFALWLKTALPFWLMVACDLTLAKRRRAGDLVLPRSRRGRDVLRGRQNHEPCALYSLCGCQRDGE